MPTPPTPYQDSPSATLPAPTPTRPVAGRPADTEAPSFDWTPVPNALRYEIQIADTEAFDSIRYEDTTERPASIDLPSVLPEDPSMAYWRVRAVGENETNSPWSKPAHFAPSTAQSAPREEALRVDAPPVPLHPDGRSDTPADQSAVPFSWESIPEASGYQLQVAPSEAFEDPTVDLTVDQTTSVLLCEMLPSEASPFYWRIRPLFRTGAPGPWSSPISFSVSPPPADEGDDLATQASDPKNSARAAGPVAHARTSRGFSLFVSLFAVLSFIATLVLIGLLS